MNQIYHQFFVEFSKLNQPNIFKFIYIKNIQVRLKICSQLEGFHLC